MQIARQLSRDNPACIDICSPSTSRMSPNRIFMFLMNPPSGNVRIQKPIAKHIFECFEKRNAKDGKVNTQGL